MLDYLTMAWCTNGYLSAPKINKSRFTPTAVTYRARFGSLFTAYQLIGYKTVHTYRYSKCGDTVRILHRDLICRLSSGGNAQGHSIVFREDEQVLMVDGSLAIAVVILPYLPRDNNVLPGWKIYFDRLEACDFVLLARMNKANTKLLDYHLFPRQHFSRPSFRFTETNVEQFRDFKVISIETFYQAAKRHHGEKR